MIERFTPFTWVTACSISFLQVVQNTVVRAGGAEEAEEEYEYE